MNKIQMSSMYGKFGSLIAVDMETIKMEDDNMIEWMEHLTQDDVKRIRLVSAALDMKPERVVKTPFNELIKLLACKVIELKTDHDYNEKLLESIEQFLEEKRK